MLYPQDRMYEEMTFLSYYLHWSRSEVMALPHLERQRWCREVSAVNKKIRPAGKKSTEISFDENWRP